MREGCVCGGEGGRTECVCEGGERVVEEEGRESVGWGKIGWRI